MRSPGFNDPSKPQDAPKITPTSEGEVLAGSPTLVDETRLEVALPSPASVKDFEEPSAPSPRNGLEMSGIAGFALEGNMAPEFLTLKTAIEMHPVHLTAEDDLATEAGVLLTAALVLDRIAEDRSI